MSRTGSRRYFKETRLQQIRAFCETAKTGGFSASAAALGISRPAVWQQIRALERQLATPLVRRKGRGVELTEDGLLLRELLAPLLAAFDSVPRIFEDRKRDVVRHLTIATTPSVLANQLIGPIREYQRRFPQVQLSLLDGTSADVIAAMEAGRVDFGIAGPFDAEPNRPTVDCEFLFAKPFWLVCHPDNPLAKCRALRLPLIVRHPMILGTTRSRWRSRVEYVLQTHELWSHVNVVLETNNPLIAPLYVSQGLGITLMPLSQHEIGQYNHLCIRSVARWFGDEKIFLMRNKGAYQAPHLNAFPEIVRQTITARQSTER